MMNYLITENLDDHYEEWNRSIYLENNIYDFPVSSNEYLDDLPAMELNLHQEQMSLPQSFSNECLESIADPLDDIDPDSLFYQKSFTELTPVKCEPGVNQTLTMSPIPMSNCLNLSGDIILGVDHLVKNWSLEPNLKQEDIQCPNDSLNDSFELPYLTKFIPISTQQDLEQQVATSAYPILEINPDFDINLREEFDFRLLSTSPNPLISTNIIFDTPVEESEIDAFETESNVSSTDSCSSTQENFHRQSPTKEYGQHSWVKEIKVGKNNRPRGPKCWEFLLRLLRDSASNPTLVKWENTELGSFKLVEKDKISAIWGNRPSKKKNGKIIKYESFARILRYHYKKGSGMVLPVSEKHLVYKFAAEVMAAYRAGKIL